MMIVDANNMVVGRMACFIAKQALLGQTIEVINCGDAVISGKRDDVFAKYKRRAVMGVPSKGPFVHRSPDKLVRKIIRNMLPFKQEKGRVAFKRIRCWKGVPEDFAGKETVKVPGADLGKIKNLEFVRISDISRFLGGKVD